LAITFPALLNSLAVDDCKYNKISSVSRRT
jgi:hypothetical protein